MLKVEKKISRLQLYISLFLLTYIPFSVEANSPVANNTQHSSPSPEQKSKSWLLSRKGFSFSLSGELELEYVDTASDGKTPSGHFQVDKFTIIPLVKIDEDISFGSLLLFKSTSTRVDEYYIKFKNLAYKSEFKIGNDDRITNEWPKRRTEAFALIDSAFARDDETGITWSRDRKEDVFWSITLSNGYKLGESAAAEDKSFKFLHDDRQTTDANQNKALGLGLGWNFKPAKSHKTGLMVYAYSAKLSNDDITTLQAIPGYDLTNDDTSYRYGLALNGKTGRWNYGAKNIIARDGVLERDGWYVQAGHSFKLNHNAYLQSIEPFIRYGEMNVDLPDVFSSPLTWDRSMMTLAVILGIKKNFKIKIEYYINDEETGALPVENNEFVTQFEAKF